eukprot:Hpha_TRINITY_DN15936_c2_g6::TRINITY_DN15936_c2_g6_i1::g.75149::m.75149
MKEREQDRKESRFARAQKVVVCILLIRILGKVGFVQYYASFGCVENERRREAGGGKKEHRSQEVAWTQQKCKEKRQGKENEDKVCDVLLKLGRKGGGARWGRVQEAG